MKVVLFCGGLGTRLREHSDAIPKPLVTIGYRPIIWHLMRYYAHYGYNDFILCLGYRGDMIKEFFLNYDECLSNDFTLSKGGSEIELHTSDIKDWRMTFVETGLHANLGERLLAVRKFLKNEEVFMANYADGLSDLPLDEYIKQYQKKKSIASMVTVRTTQSFHAVHCEDDGIVSSMGRVGEEEFWINAGFFILRNEIFQHINPGEELVEKPFQRLVKKQQLSSYRYRGFWSSMDTFKDKITFDRRYARGDAPWEVWKSIKDRYYVNA